MKFARICEGIKKYIENIEKWKNLCSKTAIDKLDYLSGAIKVTKH